MKKILLTLLFINLSWAEAHCQFDTQPFIKKLELKYKNEIKDKNFKPQFNARPTITCKERMSNKEAVLLLPYMKKDESEPNSDYYYLSLIVAVVDKRMGTIKQSYFHENIDHSEDTYFISDIRVDMKNHPFWVGVSIVHKSASSVYLQWDKRLFLYEQKENSLKPILSNFMYENFEAIHEMDEDDQSKKEIFRIKPKKSTLKHPPLYFRHIYEYGYPNEDRSDELSWEVELEERKFVYKNGKYEGIVKKSKPLFDLKEIEVNTKKGLKYKEVVLRAMLFEVIMTSKNVSRYNNIAYYLEKAGHSEEAIFLLEKIILEFPKRTVAYYNLADAYWEIDRPKEAKKYYREYMRLMKAKGKAHKIPLVVKDRVGGKSNFEKGFLIVHKKVEKVSPLLLKNKGLAKPIAIVPWKQKVLLDVDHVNDGKILKVIAYEKNGKMEFVYFLMSTIKNEVGLLKLFGINQKENNSFLIGAFPNNLSYEDIENWHMWNRDYFLVEDGYVYFNFVDTFMDKGNNIKESVSYYTYRYKLGEKGEPKKYKYDVSDRVAYSIYNHSKTMYVDADNENFSLGNEKSKKVEFITKSFKGGFYIGSANWSFDDKFVYFDNHGDALACIWRYNIESKELSKIVPEHEAEHPFSFDYEGKDYVVYIEGQNIKLATPFKGDE